MMKYDVIFWDVDDTLLDFGYSEKWAIRHCFELLGREISDAWIGRYSVINDGYWKRLERGEVTKAEVLRGRFTDLFAEMKLAVTNDDITAFQKNYQKALGEVYCYRDSSYELCKKLKKTCRQYLVTNGVESTQRNKLKLSGLDELVDGIFISEVLGAVKPQKEFFDACFEQIPDLDKSSVLLIGDSLSSDMKGAVNAGIASCWYNPNGKVAQGVKPDYEISNLWEVEKVLGVE